MNIKKRIISIDIARGVAMISVMLGHLGIMSINRVVYTYHLPLFYLISGYFFQDSVTWRQQISSLWRRLLKPYYICCISIILIALISGNLRNQNLQFEFYRFLSATLYAAGDNYESPFRIYQIGAIWFLWALFWGNCFLKLLLQKGGRIIGPLSLVIFYLGRISANVIWLPLSIQAGMVALPYLVTGYQIRQFSGCFELKLQKKSEYSLLALAICFWLWMIKNFEALWLVHGELSHGIVDFFGTLCACYVLMYVSVFIQKRMKTASVLLKYIGENSLLFLLFHTIEMIFVPYDYMYTRLFHPAKSGTLCFFVFCICLKLTLIVSGISAIKYLKRVLSKA